MNTQASFTLRGRNPDVLTCIANLSNDEVFTPPEGLTQLGLYDMWKVASRGPPSPATSYRR